MLLVKSFQIGKVLFVVAVLAAVMAISAGRAEALTPYQQDVVVTEAMSHEGAPYVFNSAYGFDCSGLTQAAYAAAGISLTDDPVAQYYESHGVYAPAPGDLVFWDSYLDGGIDHVGIYVGYGKVVEANAYLGYVAYHDVEDVPGFISYGRL